MQVTCPTCTFRYFPDELFFRRRHLVYHDEHLHGVKLRRLDGFERVGKLDDWAVLLVRPTSPRFPRLRTERVARRAKEEPVGEGGYDKPTFYAEDRYQIVPEHAAHALVLEDRARGVGLLVFERRPRAALFKWNEKRQRYDRPRRSDNRPTWTIVHVWLLPSFRGRGLARRLTALALEGIRMSGTEVAWLPPFTNAGFKLVRRFAPDAFWRAGYAPPKGDAYTPPF